MITSVTQNIFSKSHYLNVNIDNISKIQQKLNNTNKAPYYSKEYTSNL